MIPENTKKILLDMKKPTVEDILKVSMNTGYDSYKNNNHNESTIEMNELEDFCKEVLCDWYNYTSTHEFKSERAKAVTDKFSHDENVKKSILELNSKCNYPAYNFFRTYHQFIEDNFGRPVGFQEDGYRLEISDTAIDVPFIHVYGFLIQGKCYDEPTSRLYLNLKGKNIVKFAKQAYEKCKKQELPFYFKFTPKDNRNDTFLFYCNYENISSYIEIIDEIRREHEEIFEGVEKVSRNLGVINGYIGYGEEPKIYVDNEKQSYNSLRKTVIMNIANELNNRISSLNTNSAPNTNKDIFAIRPHKMTYKECIEYLANTIVDNNSNKVNFSSNQIEILKNDVKERLSRILVNEVLREGSEYCSTCIGIDNRIFTDLDKKFIYEQLERCTGIKHDDDFIGIKAYISKFLTFESKNKLTKVESKIHDDIKDFIIKKIKSDIISCTDKNLKNNLNSLLKDAKGTPLNSRGNNYLTLATARFINNRKISFENSKCKITFNDEHLYYLYKKVLGEENVDNLIKKICDEHEVSNECLCFNKSTQIELNNSRNSKINRK